MKTVVLGGGCFWCIEAVFQQVKGVGKVVSGYAGGSTDNPSYQRHGDHAEVVQLTYDPDVISLDMIFEIFYGSHDPTTDQQPGTADKGPSYRSIALVAEDELEQAKHARNVAQENWDDVIITEIAVLDQFTPAEEYHQNFYNQNPNVGYCQVIINPKLAKLRKNFEQYLK